ncbi:MAG: hypothetical protein ABSA58_00020 [Acetobacteraceae bacterium]|jgi:hypothetical protein
MKDSISSARRSDDQLLAIIDQTMDWAVSGRAGCVLGVSHSLRDALRAAFGHEAAGHHVFAICQQPGDAIIVFREQMERVAAADASTRRGLLRDKAA